MTIGDKKATPFGDVQSGGPIGAVFSPNGRWVAYAVRRTGEAQSANSGVYLQPFPATGQKFQAPKSRFDYHPVWAPDGKELFYVPSAGLRTVRVGVRMQPIVTFGSPVELQAVPRTELVGTEVRGYDVLPDGRFISLVSASEQSASETSTTGEIRVVRAELVRGTEAVGA